MNEEEQAAETERAPQPKTSDTTPGMPAVGWDEPSAGPDWEWDDVNNRTAIEDDVS